MKANETTSTPAPSGVSRRTVVKGAAWAVPVIAVASAVPAMAASPDCFAISFGGGSCKEPGNANPNAPKYFRFSICFTNGCATSEEVTVTRIRQRSGGFEIFPNTVVLVGPNDTACTPFYEVNSTNSANFIDVTFTAGGATYTLSLSSPPETDDCMPTD